MSKVERFDDELVKDLKELCVCSVNAIVAISKKHNLNPLDVSDIFINIYQKIVDETKSSI